MYPVSDAFLQAVQENTRRYYWTGRITTKSKVVHEFGPGDIVKGSGYISAQCCGGTEIELGTVFTVTDVDTKIISIEFATSEDNHKTIHYYSCQNYRKSAGRACGFKHTYNQAKIDSAVYEIVSNLSVHPAFVEVLGKAYSGDESVEMYEKRLKGIRKELYHQEHEKNRPFAMLNPNPK